MIQLYHGDGKGKTSAAAGAALRGAGRGKKIVFARFMKGRESGETVLLQKMEQVCLLGSSRDFPFYSRMSDVQKEELKEIHNEILQDVRKRLQNGKTDFVVLDEITHACNYRLVTEDILDDVLEYGRGSTDIEIILTGRHPSQKLIALSDYISEIRCVRHPFEKGVKARIGIEL